ncbi:PAS domain-containing protein [Methylobacterium mesophilicum]|uniref:PAS domain-containing protein n=1 Tax=Methylobacterium mesophilicum TaxID=39956 RepID=UPI002F353E52
MPKTMQTNATMRRRSRGGSAARVWYNQRWYDYTGTSLDEMRGWGWRTVHHPDHVAAVTERYRAAITLGRSWEDTFPLRGRDGSYRSARRARGRRWRP